MDATQVADIYAFIIHHFGKNINILQVVFLVNSTELPASLARELC